MADNLPVFSRRRRRELVAKQVEEEAFQKAIKGVATTLLKAGASMPMSSWYNAGGVGAGSALLARVTQDLAASFGRTPDDVELALAEQGLSWGPPFPPGRPLDPFWGYKRPARTWDYAIGENVQVTPRWDRISFPTLKAIIEAYDVAQVCVRHLINDVRSLDYQFVPPVNVAEDATADIEAAETFFASPDKQQPFRAWLAEWLQDVLRYDAGCLYVRKNEAGQPIALEPVDGSCYSDDTEVLTEGGWKRFADVDITRDRFATRNPKTHDFEWQYATKYYQATHRGPMCHFTARGLDLLVTPNHRMLVTSLPRALGGNSYRERGEVIVPAEDLLRVYQGQKLSGNTCIPQTSEWDVPDLVEFRIGPDPNTTHCVVCGYGAVAADDRCNTCWCYRNRYGQDRSEKLIQRAVARRNARPERTNGPRRAPGPRGQQWVISGDDFAAFMGMWLSEGCAPNHSGVYISQKPFSKGFEPFRQLLRRIMGRECYHDGSNWHLKHKALHDYLRQFGHAQDKFVPPEVKNMSRRQLEIFWEYYRLGDGHTEAGGRTRIFTSSRRMADDLQEIAQKMGYSASVRFRQSKGSRLDGRAIKPGVGWVVTLRTTEASRFSVTSEDYDGEVYCVCVPNEQLYVRRNGYPAWCCNTIIPFVDFYGRVARDEDDAHAQPGGIWPGDVVPAYGQIIQGMPYNWFTADEIIYQPWNPLPESQYGLAPMEAVLLTANTDIRWQWTFLQYFTEGTIPQGFMEAPPDLSDPAQVQEWQSTWDALMMGDQAKLRQIRWVPAGSKYTQLKDTTFDKDFPLYLMRRVAAAFGVTPNDLGFTDDINRATGDTQIDVQFRVGTLPLVRHVEDIINLFIREHLKLKARIQFDTGREVEDRLASAQAEQIYWEIGALSSDEIRMKLGKRISRERPTPRIFNNDRAGPIPILAVDSLAGKIDPTTYGPAKGQKLITDPYAGSPGTLPVSGSSDAKTAQGAAAALQAAMRGSAVGAPALPAAPLPDDTEADAAKALEEAFGVIDVLLDQLAAKSEREEFYDHNDLDAEFGPDNTGGPGVHPDDDEDEAEKDATGGVTAATGIEGNPLVGADEEDDDEAVTKAVRRWRDNSRNRVRQHLPPKRFVDPRLPGQVADAIWKRLESAQTRSQVDAVFGAWLTSQVEDPAEAVHKRALELLRPDIDRLTESARRVDAAREALVGADGDGER